MSKVVSRLLTFFIGIPAVLALVFFSKYNHLLLNIAIVAAASIAAFEFYNMFTFKGFVLFPKPLLMIFSGLIPLITYIFSILGLDINICSWVLIFEIIILVIIESFSAQTFENSGTKIAVSVLCLFYCGYMLTFLVRLTTIEHSVLLISLYFVLVFLCDSAAWFFGILFGKSTRGVVKASPNKSLVGFIGGVAACIAIGIIFWLIFPEILYGGIWKIILLSAISSFTSIAGDLFESVIKRTCNVKDSGNLIPGRGGLLDSIDSLLLTVPVYYVLVHFLYVL